MLFQEENIKYSYRNHLYQTLLIVSWLNYTILNKHNITKYLSSKKSSIIKQTCRFCVVSISLYVNKLDIKIWLKKNKDIIALWVLSTERITNTQTYKSCSGPKT